MKCQRQVPPWSNLPASLFWSYKYLINAGVKQMYKNINTDAPEKNH